MIRLLLSARATRLLSCSLLCAFLALQPALVGASSKARDVRIVVDVSGSMRGVADLRRVAVDRLVASLPNGSRAGIWTFGQQVNMAVPHSAVDESWRAQARGVAANLGVVGLRTNLRAALAAAAWDSDVGRGDVRDIVLITDGRVDVSDDALTNDAERRGLIAEVLPTLSSGRFALHSLALSADSDVAFLRQFAAATGGYAARADSAAAIESFLARTLGAVDAADATFLVDAGRTEVTLIIERPPGAELELVSPAQQRLGPRVVSSYVRWSEADGDRVVVTLANPASGRWQVEPAPLSMLVFDDLAVRVAPPSDSDIAQLEVSLTQAGRPIGDPALTAQLLVKAELLAEGSSSPLRVRPPASDSGGHRVELLAGGLATADRVRVQLFGPTFERAAEFAHAPTAPVTVRLEPGAADDAIAYVELSMPALDAGSLRLLAALTAAEGRTKLVGGSKDAANTRWMVPIPGLSTDLEVTFKISGNYLNKKDFSLATEAFSVTLPMVEQRTLRFDADGHRVDPPIPPEAAEPQASTVGPPPEAEPASMVAASGATETAAVVELPDETPTESSAGSEPEESPRPLTTWDAVGLGVLGGLNLLALIGFGFMAFERRRRANPETDSVPEANTSLEGALTAHAVAMARVREQLEEPQAA